ncbi:MAG: hypothetical protein JW917_01345 [Ignavibacteria bacterium]|nr:hypothetical protein [Ignavibacteria bacterium]
MYEITGREVATLVRDPYRAESYILDFNASNLPSGGYFYSMDAGNYREVKKMVILK